VLGVGGSSLGLGPLTDRLVLRGLAGDLRLGRVRRRLVQGTGTEQLPTRILQAIY